MRRDVILPALLAGGLTVLVGYATTQDEHAGGELASSPVMCQVGPLHELAGLREASGLASARRTPELLWSHNDSAAPIVFGLGAAGELRARVRIDGATVVDWEAITTSACESGSCLFIGDIGDNDRTRPSITVYRLREPAADDRTADDVSVITGHYPEGPQDAEAMFVAHGSLFIVTKGEGAPVRVYRFPTLDDPAPQRLQLVAALTDGSANKTTRVTDAALSPDGRWIALRGNDQVLFYDAAALLAGHPATPLAFDARGLDEPQGEGIAWPEDDTLYLAGEGKRAGTLARISCNLPR